jgi:hypothetical protein
MQPNGKTLKIRSFAIVGISQSEWALVVAHHAGWIVCGWENTSSLVYSYPIATIDKPRWLDMYTSVGQLLSFDPVINQMINPDIKNLPTSYFFSFF